METSKLYLCRWCKMNYLTSKSVELRLFIIDLSIPRVRAAFVKRFKQLFPHLAHLVDSVEDFEHWYRTVEYTKEVRRVVHIVITSLFTSELFKQIDKEIRVHQDTRQR